MKNHFYLFLLAVLLMLCASAAAQHADEVYLRPDYEVYNCPASENGRGGDLLHISGTITKYFNVGMPCFAVSQSDGKDWVVCYISDAFKNLEGQNVDVYAEYLGYSTVLGLPTVNLSSKGAMRLADGTVIQDTLAAALDDGLSFEFVSAEETASVGHFTIAVPSGWIHQDSGDWQYWYAKQFGSTEGGYIGATELDMSSVQAISDEYQYQALARSIAESKNDGSSDYDLQSVTLSDGTASIVSYTLYGLDTRSLLVLRDGNMLCYTFAGDVNGIADTLFTKTVFNSANQAMDSGRLTGSWSYVKYETNGWSPQTRGQTTFSPSMKAASCRRFLTELPLPPFGFRIRIRL